MSTTPARVLTAAADLIETTGWTRKVHARDETGFPVSPSSHEACKFCALGAIKRFASGDVFETTIRRLARTISQGEVASLNPRAVVMAYNDIPGRMASDVIDVMRRAAA